MDYDTYFVNWRVFVFPQVIPERPAESDLLMTSWREFKCQMMDEIYSRHRAGQTEVVIERPLWVKPDNYEYWGHKLFGLQKQVRNFIPNFRVSDDSGVIQYEWKLSGAVNIHLSDIPGFYRIIVKVQHRATLFYIL